MSRGNGFRVAVKESATRANEAVAELCDRGSRAIQYDSRLVAEAAAEELTNAGSARVKIQRAAPNDPSGVDGYLVSVPDHRKWSPDGSREDGWTFDTTANQYGLLGEALLTASGTPALKHFVYEDLGPFPDARTEDGVRVDVVTDPADFDRQTLRSATDAGSRWRPDCEVRVAFGDPPTVFHRYFCEIKTGDASFQRHQAEAMERVAAVADVLKIRVALDGLPDEYGVTFRRVGDTGPEIDWNETLDGYEPSRQGQADISDFVD